MLLIDIALMAYNIKRKKVQFIHHLATHFMQLISILHVDLRRISNWCKFFSPDVLALAISIEELMTRTRRARTAMWCALQCASQDLPMATTYTMTSTPNCDSIVATPKKLLPSFDLKALNLEKEIDLLKYHPHSSYPGLDENIDSDGEDIEGTSRHINRLDTSSPASDMADSNHNCTKVDGSHLPHTMLQ